MDSSPKKGVPGLSLTSLRRQLLVAETAMHDYDFTTNDMPIMKSLQSPTTRTLNAIVANREHFLRLEKEIQAAKAEERALQSLVDESESLRSQPMLSAFKGNVAREMRKVTEEREREEFDRSDQPVTATLMLSGGAKAKGIVTSLTSDGEMIVSRAGTTATPVALGDEERPTHFIPDEDDDIATGIAEQIVFTLPRDAAGTMLEVVPSTLVTAAEQRYQAAATAQRSPDRRGGNNSNLHSLAGTQGSVVLNRVPSPGHRRGVEPQTLTEILCVGVAGREQRAGVPQRSLKELLAEQSALHATAQADRDQYDDRMQKYHTWQERRLDLLDHFTKLEPQ